MKRNPRRDGQKTAQLCAQVREALSLALAGIADDVILGLYVLDVTPAPDSTRLRVQLGVSDDAEPDDVHERLDRYAGRLRNEVAGAIHRKKTPTLVYELMPRGLGPGPQNPGA
ncbi:MAG: ribosome-binding factor A [Sandaracinaceae bacterium]|nr:ribosome-binding factor A [Sandaracinaceae bacterium]